jgi:hypothetical protein
MLEPVKTHDTDWQPNKARVTLHVELDAMIVPSDDSGGARVDKAGLVVLDNLIGEQERVELLNAITEPGEEALPHLGSSGQCAHQQLRDALLSQAGTTRGLPRRLSGSAPQRTVLTAQERGVSEPRSSSVWRASLCRLRQRC